ncbi:MAG: response regulator transcription factor [Flavobacteriaceae bacterium]|nr:response regulator transcription factor [Flavobacteriaceae bacterium]
MSKYFIIASDSDGIDKITNVLEDFPMLEFIGASSNYDDVMNTILKEKPALVFLDIDTFTDTPFDFVHELSQYLKNTPQLIAISSTKDKAYDAMKLNFIDYLLTPLSELEIRKSIINFENKCCLKKKSTLCLKSYKDYQYIDTNDILFLKADNNTTEFHLKDGKVINAYKTLKTFENKLPNNFLRIHKSYVVNAEYVTRINFGKLNCTIKGNILCTIPFTKTYLDNVFIIKESLSLTLVA